MGAATIEYRIIRSRRRTRTIEINVSQGVVIAAPVATTPEAIRDIVQRRAKWILRRTALEVVQTVERTFADGESLPYLGRSVPIELTEGPGRRVSVRFERGFFRLNVPSQMERAERLRSIRDAFSAWYRRRAVEYVNRAVTQWTLKVGAPPSAVLIRNQRQRWGSCSPTGVLRINWRIVMAAPDLIDYVVVHELAHLLHHNHSKDFWAEVTRVMPDFRTRRARLREVGPTLIL